MREGEQKDKNQSVQERVWRISGREGRAGPFDASSLASRHEAIASWSEWRRLRKLKVLPWECFSVFGMGFTALDTHRILY